ncbi:MAG TPA: transglycosylase SLT domain-containing protein [Casimicrobiaceae bacterium]|nr:transglycosylase SLT domain-containing protein [Casimicrobiaceae bacterium]
MRRRLTTLCCVLALAGCATTATEPEAPPLPPPLPPPVPAPVISRLPPLPPKVVVADPFPSAAGADLEPLPTPATSLWERIVKGYAIPDLVDDPLVAKWEQYYADRPDYVARIVDRSRRYLYHIVSEIEARQMPLDLALLPMIESAMNPNAYSRARAAGIWQFIPSTGKHYGLDQNFWVDSRRDIVAATDSALDYLAKIHEDFDDWQLALAGYNWGEGNVAKAVARNRAKGLPTDYASLKMPSETRNYLPKLQAVKNIVRDPEKYGLVLADVPDTPYFTIVKTTRKMDVKVAADLAEMSVDEFLTLNPQHNRPVIAGGDEQSILLPIDRAEMFAAKLELSQQPLVTWQAYRARPGETVSQVAARFDLPAESLRAVNGLGKRTTLPAGHALLVPAQRPSDATVDSLVNTVFTTVPSGRTFYHTVRRGETLGSIARRYHVTTDDLRRWNGMSQNAVKIGQRLRVTTDVVTGGKAPKRAPATTARASGTLPASGGAGTTSAAKNAPATRRIPR